MAIQQMLLGSSGLALADPGQQVFTTTGSNTWTCPEGVYSISIVCVGAGGKGMPGDGGAFAAGGGGGVASKTLIDAFRCARSAGLAWTGCTGAATPVGRRAGRISGSSISVATAGSENNGVLSSGTSSSPSPHSSAVIVCAATTASSKSARGTWRGSGGV